MTAHDRAELLYIVFAVPVIATAIAVLLALPGCGAEPAPEVVARHEACSVRLLADGQVECKCEVQP